MSVEFSRHIKYIQLFEPANAFAIAYDHDSLKLTPKDFFLERIGLRNITMCGRF